jgi:hypothetical protein
MSIVRVGLSETENFAAGYEAIFGKKEQPAESAAAEKPEADAPKTSEPDQKADQR